MFFKQSGFTWLVVGLGNPGARYESTRHNMGFLAVDRLAEREKLRFNKLRFKAWTAEWKLGENKVLVMKPQTYMNLSGEAVGAAARFYKIPPEHILVVSDDIDLPVGKLRLRAFGSAGGHNGLKNIISIWAVTVSPASRWGLARRSRRATRWWIGSSACLWARSRRLCWTLWIGQPRPFRR